MAPVLYFFLAFKESAVCSAALLLYVNILYGAVFHSEWIENITTAPRHVFLSFCAISFDGCCLPVRYLHGYLPLFLMFVYVRGNGGGGASRLLALIWVEYKPQRRLEASFEVLRADEGLLHHQPPLGRNVSSRHRGAKERVL